MSLKKEIFIELKKFGVFFLILFGLFGLFYLNNIGGWLFNANYKPPYLSFIGDPQSSIGISFETPQPCNATVYYGLSVSNLNLSQNEGVSRTLHFFNLTNLLPNSTYFYLINATDGSYGFMNKIESFHTAPPLGSQTPIHFAVLGDTRPDIFGLTKHPVLLNLIKARNPNFVLNVGDIVMGPTRNDHWDRFFSEIHDVAKNVPYMVSMGNHEHHEWGGEADAGKTYLKYMNYPGVEQYYAFNYSNVCLISMNIEAGSQLTSTQLNWLANTLKAANSSPEINWIIVYFHVPAYSALGCHSGIISKVVQPYFIPYKVDLVFSGHHHHYERLLVDGIPYVITGGGGAELEPYLGQTPWTQAIFNTFQFCDVTINGTKLTMTCVDSNNLIIDSLNLTAWRNV
ncbi:MAG: metallophosphoesterase [Candidatus Helarchaeota archaeon]